jgi:hypothetical protein
VFYQRGNNPAANLPNRISKVDKNGDLKKYFFDAPNFQQWVLQSQTKINARKSLFHAGFIACAFLSMVSRGTFQFIP